MKTTVLLLALLCLPACYLTATCDTSITNCASCVDGTSTSECYYCRDHYYKSATSGAAQCTACPTGSGRSSSFTSTAGKTETVAVCIKAAVQLNCDKAAGRYQCSSCAAGSYLESGAFFEEDGIGGTGCSTDCKSFTRRNRLPLKIPNPDSTVTGTPYCVGCRSNCYKCEFTSTLKDCAGTSGSCAAGADKQQTTCTECNNGYYLKKDATEPEAVVPSCASCGANCKTCKDETECTTCFAGWALDGTDKANCNKKVAVSANIMIAAISSMFALFFAW